MNSSVSDYEANHKLKKTEKYQTGSRILDVLKGDSKSEERRTGHEH